MSSPSILLSVLHLLFVAGRENQNYFGKEDVIHEKLKFELTFINAL